VTGVALEGWPTTGEHGGTSSSGGQHEAAALVPAAAVKGAGWLPERRNVQLSPGGPGPA
jgi:hypothetical protein